MGGARNMYGGQEIRIQVFGGGTLGEKFHLGDPRVDGGIILK